MKEFDFLWKRLSCSEDEPLSSYDFSKFTFEAITELLRDYETYLNQEEQP